MLWNWERLVAMVKGRRRRRRERTGEAVERIVDFREVGLRGKLVKAYLRSFVCSDVV